LSLKIIKKCCSQETQKLKDAIQNFLETRVIEEHMQIEHPLPAEQNLEIDHSEILVHVIYFYYVFIYNAL